ncbi:hypothetical protein GU926_08230 [Nibribacter ruber]|uniref:Peptidase S49 domain-containing protein n=1 Tax=Nibribacter ruber TaxID=2698458 RepID=A0A6P1P1B6_9BACT|nr:S49 family peptidase [Nibribacter ruber]QHL87423.1 hypothetical protein GU926_08230 [Nibribacter ruber]
MQFNKVLSAVLRDAWAIEPHAAESYLAMVFQMMERKGPETASAEKEEKPPRVVAMAIVEGLSSSERSFMSSFSSYDDAPAGSIAIHRVEGPMMTEDFCGAPGTATMGRWIQEADAHENIIAHVGIFNSPGGTVAGTERFAGLIAGTQKPFVSFAELMCSAAYWSGSNANLIIASGKTAMVGSIGTMTTITDYSAYYEKFGIKTHTIRATDSKDKNEPYLQALKGKYELLQKTQLDPLNAAFTSSVQENREGKLDLKAEDVLTGKVYVGQAIIDHGLADEMGTFEYAVQRAAELARAETGTENANQPNSNTTMGIFSKKPVAEATVAFAAVTALAGKKGEELTAEMVDAANDELEAAGIEGAALITVEQHEAFTASVANETQLTADLATANTALETANTEIASLKAENAKLGKKPAASSTSVSKDGTELTEGTDENAKAMAELEHNKALADNPLFN